MNLTPIQRIATLLACLLCCFFACSRLQAEEWHGGSTNGSLQFTAWYDGTALQGRFDLFSVIVITNNDPGTPVDITVRIQTGSADMNDREVNQELMQAGWFNVNDFPEATFNSINISSQQPARFSASGSLVLAGTSKPVNLEFEWKATPSGMSMQGKATLSRLDWNIGQGEWGDINLLTERVDVQFSLELEPSEPK